MPSLTIISWRDIPAQVVVKRGRETAKVQLSSRFQEAVDRARGEIASLIGVEGGY